MNEEGHFDFYKDILKPEIQDYLKIVREERASAPKPHSKGKVYMTTQSPDSSNRTSTTTKEI